MPSNIRAIALTTSLNNGWQRKPIDIRPALLPPAVGNVWVVAGPPHIGNYDPTFGTVSTTRVQFNFNGWTWPIIRVTDGGQQVAASEYEASMMSARTRSSSPWQEWFQLPAAIPHGSISSWTLKGATSILLQGTEASDPELEELYGTASTSKVDATMMSGRVTASEWAKMSFDDQSIHPSLGVAAALQLPVLGKFSTSAQDQLTCAMRVGSQRKTRSSGARVMLSTRKWQRI
eukprot:711084-Amphidinium_carterae.1